MFVQNFIELSAAVHELSWPQRKNKNPAENNTDVATADSNKSDANDTAAETSEVEHESNVS